MTDELTKEEKAALKEISKKDKISYLASFPNLVDLVGDDGGNLKFLIFDPVSNKTFTAESVEIEERKFAPPPRRSLPQNMLFVKEEDVLHEIEQIKTIGYMQYNSISNNILKTDDSDVTVHTDIIENTYSITLY